jgi:hypothetical protein
MVQVLVLYREQVLRQPTNQLMYKQYHGATCVDTMYKFPVEQRQSLQNREDKKSKGKSIRQKNEKTNKFN